MNEKQPVEVSLRPWSADDLPLLERLLGDPAMMAHLGGPESVEQIRDRHERYCRTHQPGKDAQFVIVSGPATQPAGWIGYWEREWQGQPVFETGWSILPEFQGLGIATQAARQMIGQLRVEASHRFLHAFPAVENGPSNAICRKLGFRLNGEVDFEYPPGQWMRCHDWSLDLQSESSPFHPNLPSKETHSS